MKAINRSETLAGLTGKGLEAYIRPDGYCIFFLNGKFYSPPSVAPLPGNTEDTAIVNEYIPLGLRNEICDNIIPENVIYVDFINKRRI